MLKTTVKPISPSPGLTFEEFRELVGKLKDMSETLHENWRLMQGQESRKAVERVSRSIGRNCRFLGSRGLSRNDLTYNGREMKTTKT